MRNITFNMVQDFKRYFPNQELSGKRYLTGCLTNPGLLASTIYRIQSSLTRYRKFRLAGILRVLNNSVTGADFVVGCQIGPGLLIHHPNGIVIGHGVKVGARCTVLQQVTLGEKYVDGRGPHDYPTIGNDVSIGAGARVLGGLDVGDGATIGANSLVLGDVEARTAVAGTPARVLNRGVEDNKASPSL